MIDPLVGEEVLSGSTRLKSGTAQKMVLNMLSTGVMIRTGRTYGNVMVGVRATNEKLRARAERLVREVTGQTDVRHALEQCGWDVKVACVMVARGLGAAEAREALERCKGFLRQALAG